MGCSKRQSKFELLRIISMLLIIAYHIEYHTIDDMQLGAVFGGDYFCKELIIPQIIRTFGSIGNGLFILISGFFLIPSKENINILKISKKIILQFAFITLLLTSIALVIFRIAPNEGITFHTILEFNDYTWFLGYYFLIILIAKLLLNNFLNRLDEKKYFTFVVALFGVISFYWSGNFLEGVAPGLRTLAVGILLYSLGGGIRLYNPFERVRAWVFLVIIVLSYVFILISFYGYTKMNESPYAFIPLTNYSSVIVIVAVSIFEIFNRIKIKNSVVINNIAKSSLMVYLFHDNKVIYDIWNLTDWACLLKNNPMLFIVKIVFCAITTYALGTIIYLLYELVAKCIKENRRLFLK